MCIYVEDNFQTEKTSEFKTTDYLQRMYTVVDSATPTGITTVAESVRTLESIQDSGDVSNHPSLRAQP